MKKLIIITTIFFFGININLQGQEYKAEVDLITSIIGKAKKDFVTSVVTFPETKNSSFWRIYNEYELKRASLAKKRFTLITEYMVLFDSENTEENEVLMKQVFQLKKQDNRLLERTYKKMAKHVSNSTAIQFFQVEEYIRTAINNKLYANLPQKQ